MGRWELVKMVQRKLALLRKWLWRFLKEQHSLWARIIKSKFGMAAIGGIPNEI